MTSGAFSLTSLYPLDRFEVRQGKPAIGGLKAATRHYFCPSCMSWLYTIPAGFEAFVNIRSSMLDDAVAHRPYIDVWLSEGLPWVDSGATRKFDMVPEETQFDELLAAYAAWEDRVKA